MTDQSQPSPLPEGEAIADEVLGVPDDVLKRTWVITPLVLDTLPIGAARHKLRMLTKAIQVLEAKRDRLELAADRIRNSLEVSTDD